MQYSYPAWFPYALGSAFFAGLTALLGKLGVAGINSNLATFIRTIVILVATAGIISSRGEWTAPKEWTAAGATFLILSGLATAGSWLCYYRALQLGPASQVAPVDKLGVVIAMALGVLVLGETLTWQVAVGGLLVTAGVIVMILP